MVDKVKKKYLYRSFLSSYKAYIFFIKTLCFSPFKQRDKNLHKLFVLCTEGLILCILFG